jgi:hypothetical protein
MDYIGLDWIGLELTWIGLDWVGLTWIGLGWIDLDWVGLYLCPENVMSKNPLDIHLCPRALTCHVFSVLDSHCSDR